MATNRELDAEVARLMGWTNVEPDCYTPIGKEWCGDDPSGAEGFNRTGRKIVPHYSESIAAAMEVVAKLEKDNMISLTHFANMPSEDRWIVSLSSCAPGYIDVRGEASTLPEAICRAALQVANTLASSGATP